MPIVLILMQIDNIKISNRILIKSTELKLSQTGVVMIGGKNGTGKTLLLRKIHQTLNDLSVLVDQENDEIIDNLSVIENISLSCDTQKNEKIIKLLDGVNLQRLHEGCNIKTLSGGEKRFISILRALMTNKKIIILDEPTNDLDNYLVNSLISIMKAEFDEKLFILATHDDRFYDLITIHYQIKNNNLEIIKDISNQSLLCLNQCAENTENSIDFGIVKKAYKINKTYTILNLILVLLLSLNIIYSSTQDYEIPNVPDNYHDIFSPISSFSSYFLGKGALPIGLINVNIENFNDYKTILEQIKKTEKYAITYNLDWKKFGDGVAFPIEVYNPIERRSILLINNSSMASKLVKDSIITIQEIEEETKDYVSVYNTYNEYSSEEFKQVYLHLKSMSNDVFVKKVKESGILDGNYFYISKESVEFSSLIISIKNWVENAKILLACYLSILIFGLGYSFIHTKVKLKSFRIFTNLGVSTDTLYEILKEQSMIKYQVYMIFIIGAVLIWSASNTNIPVVRDIYAIMILSYFLEYYFIQKSKYLLYKLSLRRAGSWNFR